MGKNVSHSMKSEFSPICSSGSWFLGGGGLAQSEDLKVNNPMKTNLWNKNSGQ